MVAIPFANIGGVGTMEGNFDLNKNLKGQFVGVDDPELKANADRIQIWDPTLGTSGGYPAASQFFYLDWNDPEWVDWNGWYNGYDQFGVDIFTDGLPAGTGFWMIKKDGTDNGITLSGQIPEAASVTRYAYKGRYNMLSDPYPIRLMVNDKTQVEWNNVKGVDDPELKANADRIQIWDPELGTSGGYPAAKQLFYLDWGDPEWIDWNGWYNGYDMAGDPETTLFVDGFEVGQTFWYIAAGTYSTTDKVESIFKNPTKTVPAE